MQTERNYSKGVQRNVRITYFCWSNCKNYRSGKNLTHKRLRGPTTWKDMLENALSDTVNWQTRKWNSYTKFQVLAWMIINSNRKNLNQPENYHKYAHTLFYDVLHLARIGRPDILPSVNKLAVSVTEWTRACYRRLARLISYIHHNEFRQYCHMGNAAQHCRLSLFQDSVFSGDLKDSK